MSPWGGDLGSHQPSHPGAVTLQHPGMKALWNAAAGMIPPPRFTPRDKQKVPQQLISPKLGLPVCPKLQLSRREQTSPRLVSQKGNPAPGSSAPALLFVPREFPEGCRDAVECLGLQTAELWQCGPGLSTARTHHIGGCGHREWSRVCGSSWSPFLLLTQILPCSAFEAESDHTVLGSGILLGCQGLAGVVQQERVGWLRMLLKFLHHHCWAPALIQHPPVPPQG